MRAHHRDDRQPRLGRVWLEWRPVVLFFVLMLGFRSAWADWVVVPTGSMNPTIVEGDRVLVDKHAFGLRVPFTLTRLTAGEDPARGDIVIFDSPVDGTSLVKRVVGVPGDIVAMVEHVLIVNGQPASYFPGEAVRTQDLLASTAARDPVLLRERIEGEEHPIQLLPARTRRGFGPVRVPPGKYFVLGDFRDNSADSREFGFVPRRNFIGRATRVVVSLDPEAYYVPRWRRTLMPLE